MSSTDDVGNVIPFRKRTQSPLLEVECQKDNRSTWRRPRQAMTYRLSQSGLENRATTDPFSQSTSPSVRYQVNVDGTGAELQLAWNGMDALFDRQKSPVLSPRSFSETRFSCGDSFVISFSCSSASRRTKSCINFLTVRRRMTPKFRSKMRHHAVRKSDLFRVKRTSTHHDVLVLAIGWLCSRTSY
jgi:hypothetical protein